MYINRESGGNAARGDVDIHYLVWQRISVGIPRLTDNIIGVEYSRADFPTRVYSHQGRVRRGVGNLWTGDRRIAGIQHLDADQALTGSTPVRAAQSGNFTVVQRKTAGGGGDRSRSR